MKSLAGGKLRFARSNRVFDGTAATKRAGIALLNSSSNIIARYVVFFLQSILWIRQPGDHARQAVFTVV
jgi:hypothetical protein